MNLSLVVRSLAELGERESKPVCLAIGMFDGVHLGHRTVLELAIDEARSANGLAVALTFPEHPAKFLRPGQEPPLLMDPESKAKLLLDYGVDCVVLRTFDESFAEVSSEEFLAYLKENVSSLHGVCVGENFHFGKDRMGDADYLMNNGDRYGLKVCVASGVLDSDVPISSSRIRESLSSGHIKEVNRMLGYAYNVFGNISKGKGLGREIGFPTLNLPWIPEARPAYGVYLVEVFFPSKNESAYGVANYGLRPTVEQGEAVEPLFEVHLLGDGDYSVHQPGDSISLSLLKFIRPEKKFDSIDFLKSQIARDKSEAGKLVGEL